MAHHSGAQTFFLPADGIEPEVINADIAIYVGRTAQVQLDQRRGGYLIHAQTRPTTEMIADLKSDSIRWHTERSRSIVGSRYNQSVVHRERAAYGPSSNVSYQRRPPRQDSLYGSMQSQPAFDSLSARANISSSPGDYSLSRQSTMGAGDGRADTGFAALSRTSSQVDSYGGTGYAQTQPITIAGRRQRRDSLDDMYGFARSPTIDDLRSPPNASRREHPSPAYEYDRRYGR